MSSPKCMIAKPARVDVPQPVDRAVITIESGCLQVAQHALGRPGPRQPDFDEASGHFGNGLYVGTACRRDFCDGRHAASPATYGCRLTRPAAARRPRFFKIRIFPRRDRAARLQPLRGCGSQQVDESCALGRTSNRRPEASFAGTCRLPARYQVSLAVADQVGTTHALQGFAQHRPVLRIVIAQKSLVQSPILDARGTNTGSLLRVTRRSGFLPV